MGYLWTKYLKLRFLGLVPLVTRSVEKVALNSFIGFYSGIIFLVILVIDKVIIVMYFRRKNASSVYLINVISLLNFPRRVEVDMSL